MDQTLSESAIALTMLAATTVESPQAHSKQRHRHVPHESVAWSHLVTVDQSVCKLHSIHWYERVFKAYPHLRLRREAETQAIILHKLCQNETSQTNVNELIKLLLADSAREQLLACTNEHETPLTLVANWCPPSRRAGLIQLFLRLCPESAFIMNDLPYAPLHLLCDTNIRFWNHVEDPVSVDELLAFQQYAPLAFTLLLPETAYEFTALSLYCEKRAAMIKKRLQYRTGSSEDEIAEYRKSDEQEAIDACTCIRIILQGFPRACVMNDNAAEWPHESLKMDDCCVRILLEAAVQFPEARSNKNGYSVLHFICELPSTSQSTLPLLKLALTTHPHLANVRTAEGKLPWELLLKNESVTIEQIIDLYDATSPENMAAMFNWPLFYQVARVPSESERDGWNQQSEKETAAVLLQPSPSTSTSTSISPFLPSIESRRADLMYTLLKLSSAHHPDSQATLPLYQAIGRSSLTPQLQILWSATPLRVRQAMNDGRSILHDLILRLLVADGDQLDCYSLAKSDERVALLELAQRLLALDCRHALNGPTHSSTHAHRMPTDEGEDWSAVWKNDPTQIVVDYPLLFLPGYNVAKIMDDLFLVHESSSDSVPTDAATSTTVTPTTPSSSSPFRPGAHRALTHVNALGRTLFLQRLTHHAVPLRLAELEWFGAYAAFVFQQIATDGSSVLHLLVERSDCTIEMINYVTRIMEQENRLLHDQDPRTNSTMMDAPFATRTALNKLPIDVFLASGRVNQLNQNTNELHQVVNIIQTLLGWNVPVAASMIRDQLLVPNTIDSTPDLRFDRPIHSYLHAIEGRPRCCKIMKLLLGLRDSPKGDASTSSSPTSIIPESFVIDVLTSRGADNLTPLMLLCSSATILTLDEFEWIASLAPNLMTTLLGQTDTDRRNCLHRLASNKQLTPELWSRALSHATDESIRTTSLFSSRRDYSETYDLTCAHVLCNTHAERSELIIILLRRFPSVFAIRSKGVRRELPLEWRELGFALDAKAFNSLMEATPNSLRLDPLSNWAETKYLADRHHFYNGLGVKKPILSGWTGTDNQFLPIRWLLRISGLKPTQLFTDGWSAYLPRLVLFGMESNENCQKLFQVVSESSPQINESTRQRVVRLLYQVALLTGTCVTPHLSIRDSHSQRGLFADVRNDSFRDRTQRYRPFYSTICVLFHLTTATERSLTGLAARRTFLNDMKSGRLIHAALTPLPSLRMAEEIYKYAVEKNIWPKDDAPTMTTVTQHINHLAGASSPPSWSQLIHTERGRYIFASLFISLVRSKERRLIIELMRLIAPIHAASLLCPQTKTVPLHIFCNQVRGCREKIFLILLKDTLQAFDGSYERVLALVDEDGTSLEDVLRKSHNRLLREEFNYQRKRAAIVKTESTIQSRLHVSLIFTPTVSIQSPSPGPTPTGAIAPSGRLRSRGNFLTYDHIVNLPLANCLEKSMSSVFLPTAHLHPLSILQINSLLTPTECAKLIDTTGLQDSLHGEYRPDERDATRLLCSSNDLAESLWQRLQPVIHTFLDRESSRRPMGFGTFGQWRPVGLNSCFRFSNYQPGSSGFIPHRDAAFVAATNERSIFTLLIYLNTCGNPDQHDDEKHPSLGGTTTFYESTHFTPGGLIRDEGIRAVLTLPAACGSAILFPHETIHSGDPISIHAPHGKYILRTDLIFHRYTPLPLQPFELNWRNEPNYLRAVELFQAAFKHELAGREVEASEAYERSLSWRVAEVLPKQHDSVTAMIRDREDEPNEDISDVPPRHSMAGPAMRLNSDCLRLIYTYLDKESMGAGRCICLLWWTQLFPKSSAAGGRGGLKGINHQYEALWPAQMNISKAPSTSAQAESSSSLASTSSVSAVSKPAESTRKQKVVRSSVRPKLSNDFAEFSSSSLSDRLLIMPRMSQVGGISCLFSYPADIFDAHPSGCRRTMAIYTALTLSHQLPTILFDPPNIYETKSRDVAWPPLTDSQASQADSLLATRCVLSYNRSSSLGSVEWCRFDRLLHAVFHGQDIITQVCSLQEFNQPSSSSESTFTTRVRGWTFGEQSIPSGGIRPRYSVTFGSLLPSFYHASMCCSKQHAPDGTRHELNCYDKRHMVAAKQLKQSMTRRAVRISNAEEIRTLDSVALSHAHPIGVSTSTISSSPHPSTRHPAVTTPSLITVQETRSSCLLANFRTSFIGIPCI